MKIKKIGVSWLRTLKKELMVLFWLTTFLMVVFSGGASASGSPQTFDLTVIHTNDFHDYNPYALAKKAALIKKIRSEVKNVLLLDAGDIYTRGPYHKVFYGELEMAAMNAMQYDAWELGNNEFKGHLDPAVADEKLYNLINQAAFPTLCANIKTASGEYLPGVNPYIVKPVGGIKIGIIGVSSMKVKGYHQGANKIVEDPVKTAVELFPQVQKESDIQIILSHAGLSADVQMDMKLAKKGLSLIVGADDHYVIKNPIFRTGGVPIVQAGGEDNIYLGRIDLQYQNKNGKWVLVSHKGMLYPIDDKVLMDTEIKNIVEQYLRGVKKPAA